MPCRTACHNINLFKSPNLIICDFKTRQINWTIFNYRVQCIFNSFRLFMDLLHHEMLKTALFCCFCIPLNLCSLLFNLITIQIIKMCFTRSQLCKLKITDIIYISRIFENCWNIRSHICFTICNSYNHRAILTSHPNFTWIVTKHKFQCIWTTHAYHCLRNSINRTKIILFIIVINQLNNYLCISLTIKSITML